MPNSIRVAGLKHIADNLLKATLGTLSLRLGLGLGIFLAECECGGGIQPIPLVICRVVAKWPVAALFSRLARSPLAVLDL